MRQESKSLWLACRMIAHVAVVSTNILFRLTLGLLTPQAVEGHLARFWRGLLAISRTKLRVKRHWGVRRGQVYVYMSNHRSFMDIPVLMGAVPGPAPRMVMKSQLANIPLFGSAAVRLGYIPIDRSRSVQAARRLRQIKQQLRDAGTSIWISPEGRRNCEPELAAFRRGGFRLAIDLGAPVVPMWISGTDVVLPPGAAGVVPDQAVTVHVGEPIPTRGLSSDRAGIAQLMLQVRAAMLDLQRKVDPKRS